MEQSRFDLPLALLELPRAVTEMAMLGPALPWLMSVPRGDGHGVLVIPGFLGQDDHTLIMRRFLDARGYRSYGWSLGQNRGMRRAGGIDALMNRLQQVFSDNDNNPVSIVGWSLGGVFARLMAREAPGKVRQVICLGAPLGNPDDTNHLLDNHQINDPSLSREFILRVLRRSFGLPTVPTTAIYSRTDAVVPHQFARVRETDLSENIEVVSSHAGLVVNPQVFYLLGQKLAQPHNQWIKLGA